MAWGLGPVFAVEWTLLSRRWQTYALRSLVVAGLFVALVVVWQTTVGHKHSLGLEDLARIGPPVFYGLVGTQLSLIILAAPAATAGAVCSDKVRGTLLHLLVTDLSTTEIVMGKLAARLVPVFGLMLCSLPVLALGSLLGGIDLWAVCGAYLVMAGVAVLGCSLALLLSVWGRKTHEVLLLNYLFWAVVLLSDPAAVAVERALGGSGRVSMLVARDNPYWVAFRPYLEPGTSNIGEGAVVLGLCVLASLVLVVIAVLSLRPVVVREAGRAERVSPRGWGFSVWRDVPGGLRPLLDVNPVLWREWRRRRPSRWLTVVWGLYAAGAVAFSGFAVHWGNPSFSAWVNGLQAALGLLLVAVVAGMSLFEERSGGTMDLLLSTPLPTSTIVWGKWWATFRLVPLLAVLPALVVQFGHAGGPNPFPPDEHVGNTAASIVLAVLIVAYGAAVTSWGVALATWVRKPGQALAASVVVYVLLTAGLPMILWASSMHGREVEGLVVASPFFGVGDWTFRAAERQRSPDLLGWVGFWTGAYVVLTAVLVPATIKSFDGCLGRVNPDDPPPARPAPGPLTR